MLGQGSGTYRPPSGARPCASAALKLSRPATVPRVLMNFIDVSPAERARPRS